MQPQEASTIQPQEATPLVEEKRLTQLSGITERSVRHGFIMKVYGIVCCQLLLTGVVGGVVMHFAQPLVKHHQGLVLFCTILSMIIMLTVLFAFICNPGLARSVPENYMLLFCLTLAMSALLGFASA